MSDQFGPREDLTHEQKAAYVMGYQSGRNGQHDDLTVLTPDLMRFWMWGVGDGARAYNFKRYAELWMPPYDRQRFPSGSTGFTKAVAQDLSKEEN